MSGLSRRQFLASAGAAGLAALSGATVTPDPVAPGTLPRTGHLASAFEPVERAVVDYACDRGVTACSLGISTAGRTVVDRAYGWQDFHRTRPLDPTALFRVASVTKVLTRAAVHSLVGDGLVGYDDPMLAHLAIDPPADADPRLERVTIRQLLQHTGGWDRCATFDPMFDTRRIARDLGLGRPPSRRELVTYMLGQPLCFEPGTAQAYSNFGYAILGTIVEDVTGRPFQTDLERRVLRPVGAELPLGRTRPEDRGDREVWYGGWTMTTSAVDVDALLPVRCPDGGFYVEAMDASSGHLGTPRDMLAVMDAVRLSGRPRPALPTSPRTVYGEFPGTYAVAFQPTPETNVVVLTNRSSTDPWALPRRITGLLPGRDSSIGLSSA